MTDQQLIIQMLERAGAQPAVTEHPPQTTYELGGVTRLLPRPTPARTTVEVGGDARGYVTFEFDTAGVLLSVSGLSA